MEEKDNKNLKEYWEDTDYTKAWINPAREMMNKKELSFINKWLDKTTKTNILDIGAGTGRIINSYKENPQVQNIYGIDISQKMIEYCKERFKGEQKIKELKVIDISIENFPFKTKFDFISAIRVFQYNYNWTDIALKLVDNLDENGVLVFSNINQNSINRFKKDKNLETYRTNIKFIQEFAKKNNLKVLEIKTFSRIPDFFYELSSSKSYSKVLNIAESLLSAMLGKTFLGRILFVAITK